MSIPPRNDAFYWEGLAQQKLLVRVCDKCGRGAFPPVPGCAHCGHEQGTVVESSGEGTLYSWTVCHIAFDPQFVDEVPYVVGLVELPEGARLVARIDDVAIDALRDRLPLTVRWPAVGGDAANGELRVTFVPTAPEAGE
jgi:uncharacterized OB-fold protein